LFAEVREDRYYVDERRDDGALVFDGQEHVPTSMFDELLTCALDREGDLVRVGPRDRGTEFTASMFESSGQPRAGCSGLTPHRHRVAG
jgi:hypothetical protein